MKKEQLTLPLELALKFAYISKVAGVNHNFYDVLRERSHSTLQVRAWNMARICPAVLPFGKFCKSPDLTENTPGTKNEFDVAYNTASY